MSISPVDSTLAYVCKLLKWLFIRRGVFLFLVCISALGLGSCVQESEPNKHTQASVSADGKVAYEEIHRASAVYSFQGKPNYMEDEFVINENIKRTGISFFAVFDGHAGRSAALTAKNCFVPFWYKKIVGASNIVHGISSPPTSTVLGQTNKVSKKTSGGDNPSVVTNLRKKAWKIQTYWDKITATNDKKIIEPKFMQAKYYVDMEKEEKIDFGRLLTDEVLAADHYFLKIARKFKNEAGSTALIAILDGNWLTVANVGDSRGVMCDSKGKAIPLSVDQKPNDPEERKRIENAGGYVNFIDTWRVNGYLGMSRALGDLSLKDKKVITAKPHILKFDLRAHNPQFIILASDGLWDTFSNEEAVDFVKEHLKEPHFGAKSITLESHRRGTRDNITVIVIIFEDGKC